MRRLTTGRPAAALVLAVLVAGAGGLVLLAGASQARPATSSSLLAGTVSRLVSASRSLGALDPRRQIKLALPLALPDPGRLERFVAGEYRRGSASYHDFLTPQEFGRRFGASTVHIRQAVAVLHRLGLQAALPAANRLYISATGSVGRVERAFGVRVGRFRSGLDHTFYANTSDIRLPAPLRGLITGVVGLDDSARPTSHLMRSTRSAAALIRDRALLAGSPRKGVDGGATACPAAAASGGYTAPDLARAYDYNGMYARGLHGEGMSAALVEFDDYHDSNVRGMESCYGVKTPVSRRLVNGGVGGPPAGGESEDMADITTLLELDPRLAHLYVYEAPITGGAAIYDEGTAELDLYNAFVGDDKASVLSASWGYCEALQSASYDQLFDRLAEEAAAQGQQIFDATGDSGALDCAGSAPPTQGSISVEQEAAVPWVTAIGGTDLGRDSTRPADHVHHEDTWNDDGAGGGGQSDIWPMPSWQSEYLAAAHDRVPGAANDCGAPRGGLCRMVPDFAMNADPDAGGAVNGAPDPPQFSGATPPDKGSPGDDTYCATANCSFTGQPTTGPGAWYPIGGTSLAAPTAAAAAVLWDQQARRAGLGRLGLLNPLLYQVASNQGRYARDFYDVTTDTNDDRYDRGNCPRGCNPHHLYKAAAGYDMASGLGSVDVAHLGADLVKQASLISLTPDAVKVFGYLAGPRTSQPVSLTGGGHPHATYRAHSNAPWLHVSPAGQTPGTLRWWVDPRGLSAGQRRGLITVTSASGSTSTLAVTYTVGPRARIAVSPGSLRFTERAITKRGAPTQPGCGSTIWNDEIKGQLTSSSDHTSVNRSTRRTLRIFNRGQPGSTLHYEATFRTYTSSWLTQDLNPHDNPHGFQTVPSGPLVPSSGALTMGSSAPFRLASIANANATSGYPSLKQGTYHGMVDIRDLADPRTLVTVPVTLVLGSGRHTPTIAVRPRSIVVRVRSGQAQRARLVLRDAAGTCGYEYSLQSTAPWVRINPDLTAGRVGASPATSAHRARDTGQGDGFLPLRISARGLHQGTYRARVIVQSEDAVHNPTVVPVKLIVPAPARGRTQRRPAADSRSGPGFTG